MDTVVHKIGRRKTSVARIYLKKGKGNFTVNTKDWKDCDKKPYVEKRRLVSKPYSKLFVQKYVCSKKKQSSQLKQTRKKIKSYGNT